MATQVHLKTITIMSEVLEHDISTGENPRRADIANWDSLKHMELILRLEEEFQMRFTIQQVSSIQSVDDLVKVIEVENESRHRS